MPDIQQSRILQPEQLQSQTERQLSLYWTVTSEQQQQVQDVKIQTGKIFVQRMMQHIDITFNGEIITDLIQIVHQVLVQLKYQQHQ